MSKIDNLRRHEVVRIFEMHDRGRTNREIGRDLRRCHTAVGRVLQEKRYYRRAERWERLCAYARARFVMELREKRRKQLRKRDRLKGEAIRLHVINCLIEKRMSPERIAGTIGESFPGVTLSAKAIYNFTKHARTELRQYLPERGEPRRQRVANRRSRFQEGAPPKRSIDERPAQVNKPTEPGHYQADSVLSCRGGKGGVLTIRELYTRRRWYFILPNLEAQTVLPILMLFFQRLPPHLRKTLTLDNGGEWAEAYHKLEKVLPGFKVYFCHPYKAYQRGSVEQANGELRRFFPKGTDFANVTQTQLSDAESIINNWPMKCLRWKRASCVFDELLNARAA